MKCPFCGGKTRVLEGRQRSKESVYARRRRCYRCGAVFATKERWESDEKLTAEDERMLARMKGNETQTVSDVGKRGET